MAAGLAHRCTKSRSRGAGQRSVYYSQYKHPSACSLTCALLPFLECLVPHGGFADVMADGGVGVLGSFWASGAWGRGFWRGGGAGGLRPDVSEPATDAGRGEPAREGGAFPGST